MTEQQQTQVSNPVTTQQAVMVRQTASGFEQGIAATAGFFTAGPVGALASWGAIRGLQGKWAPWFVLGIPAAVGINIANLFALGLIGAVLAPEDDTPEPYVYREERPTLRMPSYNEPLEDGNTTLYQKCEALQESHQSDDFVGIFDTVYTIQTEHDTPAHMNSYEACGTVGRWSWDSQTTVTGGVDKAPIR